MIKLTRNNWIYSFTAVLSSFILLVFSLRSEIIIDSFIQVVLSLSIFLTALIIGTIALISYYSQKNSSFLFIGLGFFGAGILEIQHIILNLSHNFVFIDRGYYESVFAWHWYSPRLYLSVLLWLSWFVNIGLSKRKKAQNEQQIYLAATIATILSFIVYFFVPLFPFNSQIKNVFDHLFLLPSIFFLVTIIGYIQKGNGLNNIFQHWLVNALILNFVAEVGYNLNRFHRDSIIIDLAHLYVLISYIMVLFGLIYYTYEKYKQVEINNEIIEKINASLLKELNEKKAIQQKLKVSEERYRVLVESSPDMIAVSQDFKWIYINQTGLEFLKAKSEDEVIGHSIYEVIAPDSYSVVEKRITSLLEEKNVSCSIVEKYRLLNGEEVDVEVQAIYVTYKGVPSIQVVVRDITEKKKEEEILRQSEKLLAVGELAAGVAHEIRNPLTSLKGFTQLLQSGVQEKEEYFQVMLSELKSIDRVIGEFLLLAKPQKENFTQANINKILEEVITLLHAQAIMNDVTIIEYKEELPLIQCEINQIKQMFTNVIKNAIETLNSGGNIEIKTKLVEHDRVNIQIVGQRNTPKEQLYLEPYSSHLIANERTTGIGLMISCKVVENHQGMIDYKMSRKKGAIVDITLPIHQPDKISVIKA